MPRVMTLTPMATPPLRLLLVKIMSNISRNQQVTVAEGCGLVRWLRQGDAENRDVQVDDFIIRAQST